MFLDSKMNWYAPSPLTWNGSEGSGHTQSFDMTSAQALNSVIENVNNLIAILRDTSDTTALIIGKDSSDLSKLENERVARHISEALRALNKLALDYKVAPSCLLTPSLLKIEQDVPIATPQTANLISSFSALKQETAQAPVKPFTAYPYESSVHVKQTVEIEPPVDSEGISVGRVFESLEDAADAFRDYALCCGFNICKGNSKKDVYQEYACSARGKVRIRKVNDYSKRRNRRSIKKMCKCHIILRKKNEVWVVTTRKLQHTHDLMSYTEIKKTSKNRYIPEEIKEKALELYNEGEAPAKIQYIFENELGDHCTWSMKDLYNMLYRNKAALDKYE